MVSAGEAHLEGLVADRHYATKLPMTASEEPGERAHPLRVRRREPGALNILHEL